MAPLPSPPLALANDGATLTDAVVIGAGPVGLFQVFELGLLDIRAHLIDALPHPGGQCAELYADKPIYDIPALAVCTGRELTDRLLRQIEPFSPTLHLGQQVTRLQAQPDGRFAVATSAGTQLLARTVFIAAGAGAFQPRQLKLGGIEPFVGRQVLYGAPTAQPTAGLHVVVLGDGDDALQQAIDLARADAGRPASVTLVHRRDAFRATDDTVAQMKALCDAGGMRFVAAQPTGFAANADTLTALQVIDADGAEHALPADLLLVFLGLSPKLGPVADWGLAMARRQVVVDTATFETSVSGIFAVGDINTYPGKKKLILCGFHEATLAAFGAAARLSPDTPAPLQYTTTSPKLHRLLGVAPALSDGDDG